MQTRSRKSKKKEKVVECKKRKRGTMIHTKKVNENIGTKQMCKTITQEKFLNVIENLKVFTKSMETLTGKNQF